MPSPPLPPDLFTTFKQYKQDTEHIAGWLAATAERCGFTKPDTAPLEKVPKLKGRARKLARDAARAEKSERKEPQHVIHVHEFVLMAEHISKHSPKVVVPQGMGKIVDRVIEARSRCTEWFISNSHDGTTSNETHAHTAGDTHAPTGDDTHAPTGDNTHAHTSNDTHAHFTGVIRAINVVRARNPAEAPLNTGTNLFEQLELEEIENDVDEPKAKAKCNALVLADLPRASIQLDEILLEEEFMFAVHAFVDDMQQIREYVNSVWQSYHAGEIDLLVASVVTNTAIDLVRQAEHAFEVLLKRPKKYPAKDYPTGVLPAILVHEHLHDDLHQFESGWSIDLPSVLNPKSGGVVLCECQSKDFCFYPIYVGLKIYCDHVDKLWDRERKGYSVQYGLDDALERLCGRVVVAGTIDDEDADATQDVQRRLWKYLPEMQAAVCSCKAISAEDEVMRGVRHMMVKREIPLWCIFGAQIFIDIQDELQDCAEDALKDVRAALHKAQQSHRDHCDYVKSLPCVLWDPKHDEDLKSVLKDQRSWVFEDELGIIKQEDIHFSDPSKHHSEPDTLLKAHPLRCGLLKYDLYLQLHPKGIDMVNECGHILMMCHLYVAARLAVPGQSRWPDLELIIAKHTPERLFVGGLPKDLDQCSKRLALACGFSAVTFARNRRRDNHSFRAKNLRLLQSASAISEVFYDRISGLSEDHEVFVRRLQALLIDVKHIQRIDQQMDPASRLHRKLARTLKRPLTDRKAVQLLRTLRISLVADMPELCLDYFSLQRRCSDILNEVTANLFPQMADKSRSAGGAVIPTMKILELASCGEHLQSNKVDVSALLSQIGFGPSRMPLGDAADRLNAQLQLGVSLEDIDLVHANTAIAPNMKEVAIRPLQVVSDILESLFKRGESDIEIQKLHIVAGGTDYGCFMFSRKFLQSLYSGSGSSASKPAPWTKLVYENPKRDLGRCHFRDHAQTASQARIIRRMGNRHGLDDDFVEAFATHLWKMLARLSRPGGKNAMVNESKEGELKSEEPRVEESEIEELDL